MSNAEAMPVNARVYVAGHNGLVGSGIVRALEKRGFRNIILRTSQELDLRNQSAVSEFFTSEKPEYVFLAAAKVGGIIANSTAPADFLYDNILIEANVIHAAHAAGVRKLLFLGSVCIYPKLAPQPLKEEYLLTGLLEPSNEWYAIAKIAGIKLCQAFNRQYGTRFISALPTNLYGPGDYFDLEKAHVLPALIRKFHEAKVRSAPHVSVWGSGTPTREFCHVDDCAEAILHLMDRYESSEIINIGVGRNLTIRELAGLIKNVVGYQGSIVYDTSKPDGTPDRLIDISKISALGWSARIALEDGLRETYDWYVRAETRRGV